MVEFVAVLLLGVVSSFLSNISGGGGALILLPTLLHLKVPPLQAIGTIKLGAIGIIMGSVAGARHKGVVRRDFIKPLLIITIITSVLGPQLSLIPGENVAKLASSVLIIITALASLASWRMAGASRTATKWQRYSGYALFFIISMLFAGFGSGLGILVNYVLIGFLGMTAVETISTRRVIQIVGIPLQLVSFVSQGEVNVPLGIALIIGTALGGFMGMNMAIKKGNEFVKKAMALVSIILVISLFV